MALTTIKVPTELRDRISRNAKQRNMTLSALLRELVDAYDREQRFAAIRDAYARLPADDDYREEIAEWDSVDADLPDE